MLKNVMIAAALVAMTATAASAQAYNPDWGSGNTVSPNGGHVYADTPAYLPNSRSGQAYADIPPYGSAYAYVPSRRGKHYTRRWYYTPGWWPFYGR